ncbi:hypothetical protein K435DRAFT_782664, partial [Dendrothele bispora CBS 962.96]
MAFVCKDCELQLKKYSRRHTPTPSHPFDLYYPTRTFTSFFTEVLPRFHHNLNQNPSTIASTNNTLTIPGLLFSLLS